MIVGQFTDDNEAVVTLTIRNAEGRQIQVRAVKDRVIAAYAADSGALIGVGLLRGSVATFEFVKNGLVTIEGAV